MAGSVQDGGRTDAAGAPAGHPRRRVLHVITKLDLGGAEAVALDIVGSLHERVDFAVFGVLCVAEPSAVGRDMAARLAGWRVPVFSGVRGRFKTGGVVVAAWRLARAVAAFRPDVVHLHTEIPELTMAVARVLFAAVRRPRVLRTVHNCELWIDWPRMGRWVTERLARADVVAVSQAAALADAAIPTWGSRKVAHVVYNGVRAPGSVAVARAADGTVRVLFAGRFVPQKAPDLLPAILTRAHALVPDARVAVTIAGRGPLHDDLAAGLRGVAPGWQIEIVPPIADLAARLGEFDALLMPSRFEGLPLLAIEAALAGLPVVATRAPGLSEVIPVDYPFAANIDDAPALGAALARMIADPVAARHSVADLSALCRTRFAPEAMARAYAKAYAA